MAFEDQTVIGWRAYYSGSRVFVSTSTAWADLPGIGLLVLVIYEKGEWDEVRSLHYRRILKGGDWYTKDRVTGDYGLVMTHPEWGLWAVEPGGQFVTKKGEAVTDEKMATVDDLAMAATTL